MDPEDGSVEFNGCEAAGPVTGALVGTATLTFSGEQDAEGNGRFRGTFTLEVTMGGVSGTFEGRLKGEWTAGISESKLRARGDGRLRGNEDARQSRGAG